MLSQDGVKNKKETDLHIKSSQKEIRVIHNMSMKKNRDIIILQAVYIVFVCVCECVFTAKHTSWKGS